MNNSVLGSGARRVLLLFLALAFAGMATVSLWQRFMHPDLVSLVDGRQTGAGRDAAPAGNTEEIGQLMQKIQQNPGDVATILHLAEHFVTDKNWPAAENFLRKAVVAAPGDSQPLYLLGVVLHNQGKNAEAAECLERVVSLRDEPSVRYSLGVLYSHYLQDRERGGRHLRAALDQPGITEELASLIRAALEAPDDRTPPAREKEADASAKTATGEKTTGYSPAR